MTVYVANWAHDRSGYPAYHCWADDETELVLFVAAHGDLRQGYPHPTDWPRYFLNAEQWVGAIMAGAVMADRWAPGEMVALRQGDFVRYAHIGRMRMGACAS